MADGSFLDFLNTIQGLFQGLGSSQNSDDVPLIGDTQAPTPGFGRRGYGRRERKNHLKGKIGDMTLEADGNDAPGMLQSGANTLTNAYARRKGIDFLFKILEMQRDRELKKDENLGGGMGDPDIDPQQPEQNDVEEDDVYFIEDFESKFKKPNLGRLPFVLGHILSCLPKGYLVPMLLHLLSMFGALCFSKVRALYLDGKRHAANLQVLVEGGWGQGKAKCEDLYHALFERVITSDRAKLLEENDESTKKSRPHRIIQTAGIGLTRAKMFDVLADNQEIHIFIFESEIKALVNSLKGTGGITTDHLRKAFENGLVYQNNKLSNSRSGNYPIFLNYTITGTMGDTGRFIEKELEGGTLSRIAWTVIPEAGKELENLEMDKTETEHFRDQIDAWRKRYCYTTDAKGNDKACGETEIDMSYLFPALKKWLNKQYDQSIEENNPARRSVRARSACIAFHCAMVLHMLYDHPLTTAEQQEVIDTTIYLANYVSERFLFKFQSDQNELYWKANAAEKVKKGKTGQPASTTSPGKKEQKKALTDDELAARILKEYQRGVPGHGWDSVAAMLGISTDRVRYLYRKYTKDKDKEGGAE